MYSLFSPNLNCACYLYLPRCDEVQMYVKCYPYYTASIKTTANVDQKQSDLVTCLQKEVLNLIRITFHVLIKIKYCAKTTKLNKSEITTKSEKQTNTQKLVLGVIENSIIIQRTFPRTFLTALIVSEYNIILFCKIK